MLLQNVPLPNKTIFSMADDGNGPMPVCLFVFDDEDQAERFVTSWQELHPVIVCCNGHMNAVMVLTPLWEQANALSSEK